MMKKIIAVFILILTLWSCKKEPRDYVTLSGEVKNLESDIDSLRIFVENGYSKLIPIQEDGTFQDTLHITEGKYRFKIGNEYGTIYLKNDDEINLTTDYKDFDKQLSFSGKGESVNKTKVQTSILQLMLDNLNEETLELEDEAFDSKMSAYKNAYQQLKADNSELPASFWKESDAEIDNNIRGFTEYRASKQKIKAKFADKPSPSFTMESIEGNNISLEDFRGKYVYVDVWATWCGPCKREIPSLKEVEKKYHDKDIVFVSMSIDEPKDKEKWKAFVQENNLTGVQIYADKAWEADFIQKFEIRAIPRFILIGPEGNVVSADAPRPSSDRLIKLFESLKI